MVCHGCISISDRARSGIEPFDNIVQSLAHWQPHLQPKVTTIFGGEPCLHPKLIEICQAVRSTWPDTVIRLITNGYLLDNFDPKEWFTLGLFEIQISVHRPDHESVLNNKIKHILKQQHPWTVSTGTSHQDHRQMQWQYNNLTIYKSLFKEFVVPYQGTNTQIQPWYSDPAAAHKICGAPSTPILYKGKLYKCPAVANAMDITKKNWFDYEPAADLNDLDRFVSGIGVPESVCAQCPDQKQAVIIDHLNIKNVTIKQKNIG
jgi:organic radical activating enzyme